MGAVLWREGISSIRPRISDKLTNDGIPFTI